MYSTVSQWTSGGGRQRRKGAQHNTNAVQGSMDSQAWQELADASCLVNPVAARLLCITPNVCVRKVLWGVAMVKLGSVSTQSKVACSSMRLGCVTAYLEAKCPCHGPWRENLEHVWECTREAESNTHKPKKQQREVRKGGCVLLCGCVWLLVYVLLEDAPVDEVAKLVHDISDIDKDARVKVGRR